MLHWKKPKVKVVFVDTLEYQGTLDIMAHPAETGEMDFKVTKVIEVSPQEKHCNCGAFYAHFPYITSQFVMACVIIIIVEKENQAPLDKQAMMVTKGKKGILVCTNTHF